MIKKFFNYPVYFVIVLSIIGSILFGALLRHHYMGFERFQSLQKIAVFFAEIPANIKFMLSNKTITGDVIQPINNGFIYDNKKFFDKKLITSTPPREELILISRYDADIGRPIVEIRDLNTFEVLHSYLPDIEKIYEKIDLTKEEFKYLKRDKGYNRFYMLHPEITSKGELIFQSDSPLIKVNFKSQIVWVNDEDVYHHSIYTDLEGNIYVPSRKVPFSKKVNEYVGVDKQPLDTRFFLDDAISILNKDGKVTFTKSIAEILIENGHVGRIFSQADFNPDPIHLNDIQPVLKDTPYFKKGDLFLSLRNLSMVILYRPSSNRIVQIIEGGFFNQHDVDILDDKTISIYNNNNFSNYQKNIVKNNNEIIIYNFDTNSFSKKFEDTLRKNKINTIAGGLVDFLNDGSAIIEDYDNGRIFYLNSNGEVIWEFNNLNSKKQIYMLWWARIINPEKSKELKKIIAENNQ